MLIHDHCGSSVCDRLVCSKQNDAWHCDRRSDDFCYAERFVERTEREFYDADALRLAHCVVEGCRGSRQRQIPMIAAEQTERVDEEHINTQNQSPNTFENATDSAKGRKPNAENPTDSILIST